MHYSDNETVGLLSHHEDDDSTVHEITTEKRHEGDGQMAPSPCGKLERCDSSGGKLSCQTREL